MSNSEGIALVLTKPIQATIRTAYMRAYEKLSSGEKDEMLIQHRMKNFETLFCPNCKKELVVNNQIFLIKEQSRFNAYCEDCGIGEFDDFFIADESKKKEQIRRI